MKLYRFVLIFALFCQISVTPFSMEIVESKESSTFTCAEKEMPLTNLLILLDKKCPELKMSLDDLKQPNPFRPLKNGRYLHLYTENTILKSFYSSLGKPLNCIGNKEGEQRFQMEMKKMVFWLNDCDSNDQLILHLFFTKHPMHSDVLTEDDKALIKIILSDEEEMFLGKIDDLKSFFDVAAQTDLKKSVEVAKKRINQLSTSFRSSKNNYFDSLCFLAEYAKTTELNYINEHLSLISTDNLTTENLWSISHLYYFLGDKEIFQKFWHTAVNTMLKEQEFKEVANQLASLDDGDTELYVKDSKHLKQRGWAIVHKLNQLRKK